MDYDKDIDKDSIGPEYLPAWEKFGLFSLKAENKETTVRAAHEPLPPQAEGRKTLSEASVLSNEAPV